MEVGRWERLRSRVEGAITVQPLAEEVEGFKDYFLNLRPGHNTRNPWFVEYWEQHFACKYPGSAPTPFNQNYDRVCTGQEQITEDNGFEMEAQLQFVSDAVLAFAYAFKDMHDKMCGSKSGLCPAMTKINGDLLKEYLLKVRFTDVRPDGTRLYSEVVQSLPSPTHHAKSNPRHTQHNVRQHEQTVTETAKWCCEEDPHYVSYQSAENDDSVAEQRSDGSSRHTDDQTDSDKTGSDNAGLCYTEEGCPAVTNRDSQMTTTSDIEEPEVMSGAVTGCEKVIAAPQTAASDTDTETKATKETKDWNKCKKTEPDENRRTHNADGYMSIRPNTITSQYHYVSVPLRPSTIVSQYHYVPVPLHSNTIGSQYHCVPVPLVLLEIAISIAERILQPDEIGLQDAPLPATRGRCLTLPCCCGATACLSFNTRRNNHSDE
ncbi:hypothetical protein ACOMHN_066452 [Nucella lapillus]